MEKQQDQVTIKDHTLEVNRIIVKNDLRKWQLAQVLGVNPSYVSLTLRDGFRTDDAARRYYKALNELLDAKEAELVTARTEIKNGLNELEKAAVE